MPQAPGTDQLDDLGVFGVGVGGPLMTLRSGRSLVSWGVKKVLRFVGEPLAFSNVGIQTAAGDEC